MSPLPTQGPGKRIGLIVFLAVAVCVIGFVIYQYGGANIRDFLGSSAVPPAEQCKFEANPQVARTIRIGPDFADGAHTCLSLPQLYARSPDFCVRPGDRIFFQQGKTFFGRLKLRECAGPYNAPGEVTIKSVLPASLRGLAAVDNAVHASKNMKIPAEARKAIAINPDDDITEDKTFLIPAKRAASMKVGGESLKWEKVTSETTVTYNGKVVPYSFFKDKPIYRMKVPDNIKIKQFYYNNWMLPVARHPNTPTNPTLETSPSAYFPYNAIEVLPAPGHRTDDPVGKIYTTHITARPTDNALESLKTYGYGPDAAVVVRNSAWSLARKPLALGSIDVAGDPQGFTLKGSTTGPVVGYTPDDPDTVGSPGTYNLAEPGHGFILMNALSLMDQPGEWYFDPSDPNQYLYFYYRPFPDETEPKEETSWFALDEDPYLNASSYMNAGIEFVGKVDNEGKSVGKISAIRIEGLRVFTSAGAGIRLKSVPTVAINNVYVSSTTDQGMSIIGSNTVSIEDSFVSNTGNMGISVGPSFVGTKMVAPVENITIARNTLNKIGRIANQSAIDLMSGIRVAAYFKASITDNTISNTAYSGISIGEPLLSDTSSLDISRNIISFFLGLLNDGGGIYVNGMELAPDKIIHTNKTISGNTISNPIGNRDGTPFAYPEFPCSVYFGGSEVRMIGAIYLDHVASYYKGHSNVVTGVYEPYSWLVRNRGIGNCFPPLKKQGLYLVEDCFSEGGDNTFEPRGSGGLPQCGGKTPIPLGQGKGATIKVDR